MQQAGCSGPGYMGPRLFTARPCLTSVGECSRTPGAGGSKALCISLPATNPPVGQDRQPKPLKCSSTGGFSRRSKGFHMRGKTNNYIRLKSGELELHEEDICRTSVQGDCTRKRHSVQPGKVLEACSQFSGRWWGARAILWVLRAADRVVGIGQSSSKKATRDLALCKVSLRIQMQIGLLPWA